MLPNINTAKSILENTGKLQMRDNRHFSFACFDI